MRTLIYLICHKGQRSWMTKWTTMETKWNIQSPLSTPHVSWINLYFRILVSSLLLSFSYATHGGWDGTTMSELFLQRELVYKVSYSAMGNGGTDLLTSHYSPDWLRRLSTALCEGTWRGIPLHVSSVTNNIEKGQIDSLVCLLQVGWTDALFLAFSSLHESNKKTQIGIYRYLHTQMYDHWIGMTANG